MNVLSKPVKMSVENIISDDFQQCIYFIKLIVIRRLVIDIVHCIQISNKSFYNKHIKGNTLFKHVIKDATENYSIKENSFFGMKCTIEIFYIFLIEEFYYNWLSDFRKHEMYYIYQQIIIFDKYFELHDTFHIFNKPISISDQIIIFIRSKTADSVKFQTLYSFMCYFPFIFPINKNIEDTVNCLFDQYIKDDVILTNVKHQLNINYLYISFSKIIWNIKRFSNQQDVSFLANPDSFVPKVYNFIYNYFVLFIVYNPFLLKQHNGQIIKEYNRLEKLIKKYKNDKNEYIKLIKFQYKLINSNLD